jgi:hypothetical protein
MISNVQSISQSYCNTSPYLTTILNGDADIGWWQQSCRVIHVCVYDIKLIRKSIGYIVVIE